MDTKPVSLDLHKSKSFHRLRVSIPTRVAILLIVSFGSGIQMLLFPKEDRTRSLPFDKASTNANPALVRCPRAASSNTGNPLGCDVEGIDNPLDHSQPLGG